jgi:hypothetical protein
MLATGELGLMPRLKYIYMLCLVIEIERSCSVGIPSFMHYSAVTCSVYFILFG